MMIIIAAAIVMTLAQLISAGLLLTLEQRENKQSP